VPCGGGQAFDRVFIVLIGRRVGLASAFNLPGPDLAAADFARLVGRFAAQQVVFVNTASASGGFVAALSAKDRTVITATRPTANATRRATASFREASPPTTRTWTRTAASPSRGLHLGAPPRRRIA
jgi:hypothetical protein